jgi:hypothetical protein
MDVAYVFLLYNNVAYVGLGTTAQVTGKSCGFTEL